MKIIARYDAEIALIAWGFAGGFLGLFSVLIAMAVLR